MHDSGHFWMGTAMVREASGFIERTCIAFAREKVVGLRVTGLLEPDAVILALLLVDPAHALTDVDGDLLG